MITGTGVDGSPLSSNAWKGKVTLVDFWATWCVPCVQQLPRVKALYAKHRAEGLEVLGVSSDHDAATLKEFVGREGITWPQLFDPKAAGEGGLHPAARESGIEGLPVMLLIDRKGVVRTIRADEDLENFVTGLLAEPS